MNKTVIISILVLLFLTEIINAQSKKNNLLTRIPKNYEVKSAIEIESLVPIFFWGGYHIGIGYRYKKYRVRVSVINGGDYNVDSQALNNTSNDFERYYKTGPGLFLGYNIWKNLELHGYIEGHTFQVKQLSTGEEQYLKSLDVGIGISYQFFIGRIFYIQPGVHSYFRANQSLTFSNNEIYNIPTVELTPILRLGIRIFKQF